MSAGAWIPEFWAPLFFQRLLIFRGSCFKQHASRMEKKVSKLMSEKTKAAIIKAFKAPKVHHTPDSIKDIGIRIKKNKISTRVQCPENTDWIELIPWPATGLLVRPRDPELMASFSSNTSEAKAWPTIMAGSPSQQGLWPWAAGVDELTWVAIL